MDIEKLCDKLFEDKDIQDIPIDYVFRVAYSIMKIIATGECFFKNE
jgi:hypothetical protein